jgi:hypothetical protein
MRRRVFMLSPLVLSGGLAMADEPRIRTLQEIPRWLDGLERAGQVRATGAWPLSAVLDHLAQSIEMSLDGYPAPRSALFQKTAGNAAFALFKMRGRMSHGLAEPVPGAPALAAGADWRPTARRLRSAVDRFDAHTGNLQPHFAYGPLAKGDYALAHAFHVANHQDEIVVG